MLGLSLPQFEGHYLGFKNLVDTNTTNWIPVVSSDFKDSKTGLALSAGLVFANVTIINLSNETIYLRLRDGDIDDGVDGEIPLTASGVFGFNTNAGLKGDPVTTIQVKKAVGTDEIQFIATFNQPSSTL